MRRIWKDMLIDRIGMVNRGVFVVRFLKKEHQVQASNMNGFLFDRKPFVVKPWSTNISFAKPGLTIIPVWAKLHQLNLRYWTDSMLKRMAGYLGVVLKVDEATLLKSRKSFARVLVQMNVEEGFPEELYFSNEYDEIITQPVQYDWIPI